MSAWLVSVIIPAYNSAGTIGETLTALEEQTFQGPVEIIVVDDGSTDATRKVVEPHARVKYFFQPNSGPASARNFGARSSAGDILLFTDSDCRPERQWIEEMVRGFSSDDIAVVAGSYGIANPGSWLARVIHQEIKYRHDVLMSEFPRAFGSYNFAIRRSVFKEVGGFNADYRRASGEDNDLSYKVLQSGRRIRFLRHALVDHHHQTDLGAYMREQFRHGHWRVRMYIDYPGMAAGDDYTFWKDIAEVPVAFLSLAFLFFLRSDWRWSVVFGFLLMEAGFGVRMMAHVLWGAVAGGVFFLRSYVRAVGFLTGVFTFVIYLIMNRKKT